MPSRIYQPVFMSVHTDAPSLAGNQLSTGGTIYGIVGFLFRRIYLIQFGRYLENRCPPFAIKSN